MAAILRLSVYNPSLDTEFPNGLQIYETTTPKLVSVIATNKSSDTQRFHIYVVGAGDELFPSKWGSIVYNLPITGNNAYETFRFGLNPNDKLYVAGSSQISYYVQGITQ